MIEDSLSKSQKKIARDIIEKGLLREFAEGISKQDKIIEDWKSNKRDNRETYHKLYKTLKDFDKHIAWRYDAITGSEYLIVIAGQLADNVITEEELSEFNEDVRNRIIQIAGFRKM